MPSVHIKGVSKQYLPGNPVLLPIDLAVSSGELFFLLGPSGCGKSTLLRIIAGFVTPDSGTVSFDQRDITNLPPEKRRTAMVFQNYALWPHMTVYENVAFGLEALGVGRAELDRAVKSALETVQLSAFQGRSPMSLSGGQQQRVALARALAVNPEVLLLDEPLSNLDAKLRDSMRIEIRRICKERGLTAIYVTHDRREALSMADRIAVLDKGAIQQIGQPDDLYRSPATRFVAGFLGDCNLVPATVMPPSGGRTVVKTVLGELLSASGGTVSGAEACVMIRPECVILDQGSGPNTFEGTVEGGVLLGETSSWNISSNGCRLAVTELGIRKRKAGDKCCFRIDPGNVVLLP